MLPGLPILGVASYSPLNQELVGESSLYVGAILRGAKPSDLPVEQPTVFDLGVNLKTAKAIGLTIPSSILAQATVVVD